MTPHQTWLYPSATLRGRTDPTPDGSHHHLLWIGVAVLVALVSVAIGVPLGLGG